jgi:hypothetical protein
MQDGNMWKTCVLSATDMATMPRSLRIPEDVWLPAVAKARRDGTTVTAVVVAALRAYLRG